MEPNLKTSPVQLFQNAYIDRTTLILKVRDWEKWHEKLVEKLQNLKQKALDAMESENIKAFSELEETISYYRGKICIPIDEVLGVQK